VAESTLLFGSRRAIFTPMVLRCSEHNSKLGQDRWARSVSGFLVARAHSVIMFAALFCTLAVKLFHACRNDLTGEYLGWILADVSFLVGIEVILSLVCFRWPRRWVARAATIFAAIVCTWSVMNAGWLIRTGTQILPRVLLPLVRAPVSALYMIGVNLATMPAAAVILLAPSAIALAFFFFALARPAPLAYDRRRFGLRVVICSTLVLAAVVARPTLPKRGSSEIGAVGLRHNSQLRAVLSLVVPDYRSVVNPQRRVPSFDEVEYRYCPS
jgi:hypothetical protein